MSTIERIQSWYLSQCNGDWEHTYGVSIGNIDNPGWELKIELIDTALYEIDFPETNIQRKEDDDWVQCVVEKGEFLGFCGPKNLDELLTIFLDWAEMHEG